MLSARDLEEIRRGLCREPTDVELACFENLWSEHCSYRSTRALLKTLPTTGPDVILGPGDDAAIVRFNGRTALAVSMESHNHPSYVDPYDGAATGVGGIVRDVLSMGARPIALMDPLSFGTLEREKNRYLFEHVVAGIGGYGNCIGVPVVRGDLCFDPDFSGNPLVNVVCIGTVDPGAFLTARVKRPGNKLILVGSATGRDGLGGASFASRDLSENAEASDRPSVQIGDPYTEKLLIDAVLEMAATGKVLSCRDLGAAGLAGASSEMCSTFGGHIYAERVHQRETSMQPVEIMLAESQERMLLEVAPEDVPLMGRIAEKYDLSWSEVGEVIAEPVYRVTFHGRVVCEIPIDLLVSKAPPCTWDSRPYEALKPFCRPGGDLTDLALKVLSHPEVASKNWVFEQYDHDVQLRTVSLGPDAAVLRLDGEALSLSCGCNPRHVYLKPYEGAWNAVLENASNLSCVGASPLCIVDCLNFASPVHPEVYWQISECVRGLGDAARDLGIPVVGGNVSLYNESDEHGTRIKPTPSIGMLGKGPLSPPIKPEEGWGLALLGEPGPHFGGSVLDAITGCGGDAPPLGSARFLPVVRERVCATGGIAATDISQGGLLAALVTYSPGCTVTLGSDLFTGLFSETYGRFLLAFRSESDIAGIPCTVIGTLGGERLDVTGKGERLVLEADEVRDALSSLTRSMQL